MMRRLVAAALFAALLTGGLVACQSKPCCHPRVHQKPLESAWVCPLDGAVSTEPALCPHCGSVMVQQSMGSQTTTEDHYSVR